MTSDLGKVMILENLPDSGPRRRFLHVVFLNGNQRWYELDEHGWKLDTDHRTVVVGKGLGRKHIPLDNVEYYSPE